MNLGGPKLICLLPDYITNNKYRRVGEGFDRDYKYIKYKASEMMLILHLYYQI